MRAMAIGLALLAWTPSAHAADVLFVSDGRSDLNIPEALRVDGHEVTVAIDDYEPSTSSNPTLMGDLSAYDCIVWSPSREGLYTHRSETYVNLTRYVSAGGRLLVTGFWSLGADETLPSLVGGVASSWNAGIPLAVAPIENSLTTGVIDIRAVIPDPYEISYNGIGGLAPDVTVVVMGRSSFGTEAPLWTLRRVGLGEIAYLANGGTWEEHPSWTNTASAGPGAYNAALRNFVSASETLVAGAPRVRFTAESVVDEGTDVTFTIDVLDAEGDTYEIAWDVDGDGFDDALGARSVERLAADGDSWLEVSVRVVDSGGHATERTRATHVLNVNPWVFSTPPTTVSIGENVAYRILIDDPAGALDTTTLTLERGPASATLEDGVFHYVPTLAEVTGETRFIDCEIFATDGEGASTHAWRMHVVGNHAPTDLSLESPIDDAMADATPRLTVRDGTDLDGDPLQYIFEVDVVETFDSSAAFTSGPIAETPGFTHFDVPEPLAGGRYYWRAWLTDGTTSTAPQSSTFVVPSAIAPDAGIVAGDGGELLTPTTTRGCACSASSSGAPSRLWLLALGAVICWLRRRR